MCDCENEMIYSAYNDIENDDIIIKLLWPTMISVIQYY